MQDPKVVYADRVDWYVHGRPSYPEAVLRVLADGRGLDPARPVADVGSGTGMLTGLVLGNGNRVYAVEPNASMRAAAESAFEDRPGFTSVAGTAEHTNLPDGSVEVVTVGQALHWFDLAGARAEFRRIQRPGGEVLLVWNEQPWENSAILGELHGILVELAPQYARSLGSVPTLAGLAEEFFDGGPWTQTVLPNAQLLGERALLGRVLSSSYAPGPDEPERGELVRRVTDLHRRRSRDGVVEIEYQTFAIHGRL